jgi:hypothetical protein
MICRNQHEHGIDVWSCDCLPTQSCNTVSCEAMKNAKTTDRDKPYLINVTSSTFSIGIAFNRISYFEDAFLSDYPGLYGFATYGNPITKIGKYAFEGVKNLKVLEIYNCSLLEDVEEAFEGIRSLEELLLRSSAIHSITSMTLANLFSMRYLVLANNSISHVDKDAFKDLTQLENLLLSRNKISFLHSQSFRNQRKLTYLELQWNMLETVSFPVPIPIKGLWLQNNNIRSLAIDTFKNLYKLTYLDLLQNPLSVVQSGQFNFSESLLRVGVGCCDVKGRGCHNSSLTIEKGAFATQSILQQISIGGCVTKIKDLTFDGVTTQELTIRSVRNKVHVINIG